MMISNSNALLTSSSDNTNSSPSNTTALNHIDNDLKKENGEKRKEMEIDNDENSNKFNIKNRSSILNGVNSNNTIISNNLINNLKRSCNKIDESDSDQNIVKSELPDIIDKSNENIENEIKKKKLSIMNSNKLNIDKNQKYKNDKSDIKTIKSDQHLKYLKLKQIEINLRNEEAKLLLLKRLYYSQRIGSNNNQAQLNARPNGTQQLNSKSNQHQQKLHQPQQLKNSNLQNQPNKQIPNVAKSNNNANLPSRPVQIPPQAQPANQASNKQNQNRSNNNNSPIINTPNNKNLTAQQTQPQSSSFSPIPTPNSNQTIEPNPQIPKKPNAQTQALVNQLVRKEFEKSLNQLEFPPRIGGISAQQQQTMQQDIYFLPNANSPEFLMCLGLEEVVKCVQEHLSNKQQQKELKEKQQQVNTNVNNDQTSNDLTGKPETVSNSTVTQVEIKYEYPFYCTQCLTDFTPVWRQDKNGVVMCEKCLKHFERKQIKQEHSSKLKQLFVKATKDKEVFEKQVLNEQQQQALMQQQNKTPQTSQQQNPVAKGPNSQTNNMNNVQRNASPANLNQKSFQTPNNTINRPSPNVNQQIQQRNQTPSNNLKQTHNMSRSTPNHHSPLPQVNSNQNLNQRSNPQNINKHQSKVSNETTPTSQTNSNLQRQRTSAGSGLLNHQNHSASSPSLFNQGHNLKSANSSNNPISNNASPANASLAALTSQFPFAGLPQAAAFAALAQQQQQQQQAALLQRLIQNQPSSNNFNLLAGLNSPAAAALNYLNMSMFSPTTNQPGKQWKNP